MNLQQFLAMCISEECHEAGQRAIKLARFGAYEVQKGQPLNNMERLENEIDDIKLLRVLLLRSLNITPWFEFNVVPAKLNKIVKYAQLSCEQGQLPPEDYERLCEIVRTC